MRKKGSKKKPKPICQTPLPREPYTWLLITDVDNNNVNERHIFYSLTEDRYYIRFVPDLHNKHICCCYQGWLVLKDKSTDACEILNILTTDKFQLPSLDIPLADFYDIIPPYCILSSPVMDRNCRVIFFEPDLHKFRSCHIGESEFVERELIYDIDDMNKSITKFINFKGKLYALTSPGCNLLTSDFLDPGLYLQQVVSGESFMNYMHMSTFMHMYLVESCDDLLLIVMGGNDLVEISDVYIFRADFDNGEWVEVGDSLVDRAIFVGLFSTFSSPASSFGLKGNALYWVRTPYGYGPPSRMHLYMYDIDDKSVSVSLPCPYVRTLLSIFWLSFPVTTCNEKEKSEEQKDTTSLLFEAASPIQTTDCLNRQIGKPRKTPKNIEICSTKVAGTESLWSDIPTDILLEIFPRLFAGEKVAFRCVCRSWYSIPHSLVSNQQHLRPLKTSSDSYSPFLMCPNNIIYHPIYDELYSLDGFHCAQGEKVWAAKDGWLLMDNLSAELFFYNPFTKSKLTLPDCDVKSYFSFYFMPPTSADFLVIVAALRWNNSCVICYMRNMDEGWTYREIPCRKLCFHFCNRKIPCRKVSFEFCNCNAVVHGGMFYFLGTQSNLLVFNPEKDQIYVSDAPEVISSELDKNERAWQRYLLESDYGKLLAVFVGENGSFIHVCEWNVLKSEWKILESLGNNMLFVSRPLSLCKKAIVTGTGNKIYFPRVGDGGHILFYSLATRMYHTFAMGITYPDFCGSKYFPWYNGWFIPEPDSCSSKTQI